MSERRPRRTIGIVGASALLVASALAGAGSGAVAQEAAPAVVDPERVLSHFLCYGGKLGGFPDEKDARPIGISGPMYEGGAQVRVGVTVCNPVQKKKGKRILAPIRSGRQHLRGYDVDVQQVLKDGILAVTNQFDESGPQQLEVSGTPNAILVPTRKFPDKFPRGLDHFVCHQVLDSDGFEGRFKLKDQFRRYRGIAVGDPWQYCAPMAKEHGSKSFEIKHPDVRLVCYRLEPRRLKVRRTFSNQFEKRPKVTAKVTGLLCVPSLQANL